MAQDGGNHLRKLQNFIDGEFKDPMNGSFLESFNPATGEAFLHVPDSDAEDINAAVAAAKKVLSLSNHVRQIFFKKKTGMQASRETCF